MKTIYKLLAVLSLTMLFVSQSYAGPIVYGVNRTIGASTVIGTITTDGTIGTLDDANITAFSLTVADAGYSNLITNINGGTHLISVGSAFPGPANGSPLSATASQLLFDFSSTGFAHFQLNPVDTGTPFWCLAGSASTAHCLGTTGAEMAKVSKTPAVSYISTNTRQGVVVATAVPEPGVLSLLGLGLLGLGITRRRQLKVA